MLLVLSLDVIGEKHKKHIPCPGGGNEKPGRAKSCHGPFGRNHHSWSMVTEKGNESHSQADRRHPKGQKDVFCVLLAEE